MVRLRHVAELRLLERLPTTHLWAPVLLSRAMTGTLMELLLLLTEGLLVCIEASWYLGLALAHGLHRRLVPLFVLCSVVALTFLFPVVRCLLYDTSVPLGFRSGW